jgi:spore maturation protein B
LSIYIIPAVIICIFVYAFCRGVNTYRSFVAGAKAAIGLVVDILPFICTILVAIQLLALSGVLDLITRFLSPVFRLMGIPTELAAFVILKPFSGGGSIALFENIVATYGADSYITRAASVIAGSTETVFYISAVYFSRTKIRRLGYAIPLAIFCTILSAILACIVCKFM